MNPEFWFDFFGRLAIESSVLVAFAAVISRKLSAQQQRLVWQVTLAALLVVFAVEATGLHRRMRFSTTQGAPTPVSRQLTIEVKTPANITPFTPPQSRIPEQASLAYWLPGMIWLVVCGGIVVRSFGSRLLFVTFASRRRRLNDPVLLERVSALAGQMNLRGRIHLSESEWLSGPIAFGFLRRCICLPASFREAFTVREQEVMLAHELAHLAGRDPLWYAVGDLAVAMFWFNPLVWFARRRFQMTCERAADEASLLVDEGPAALAECLVQFGKRLAGVNSFGWIGVEGTSGLGQRVAHLLALERKSWRRLSAWWTALTSGAATLLLAALLFSSAAYAGARRLSLSEHLAVAMAELAAPRAADLGASPKVTNTPPQQLMIEVKFVEFSDPFDTLDVNNLAIGGGVNATNSLRGILPPSRYGALMKRLEAQKGVSILTAPKVTTLSGRQAQIKVVETKNIFASFRLPGATDLPKPLAESQELGPVLDVVPVVRPDGFSIELTLVATIREFLGYESRSLIFDSGPPRPLTPAPIREYLGEKDPAANVSPIRPPIPPPPAPRFRARQAQATVSVWDGQTAVLAVEVGTTAISPVLKLRRGEKTCFLFVTPVVIDPAGNRVHNESALPFIEQTVPK